MFIKEKVISVELILMTSSFPNDIESSTASLLYDLEKNINACLILAGWLMKSHSDRFGLQYGQTVKKNIRIKIYETKS